MPASLLLAISTAIAMAAPDAQLEALPDASGSLGDMPDGGPIDGGGADGGAPAISDAGAASTPALPDAGAPIVIDLPDPDAPRVRAAAERGEVVLGAPFTVFVTVEAEPGINVNLREPLDLGPAFEVRRKVSEIRPRSDGGKLVEWQLEVMAWEVGDLKIPPIAVTFVTGGRAGQVHTAPAPVRVLGSLGEDDDGRRVRGLAPPTALSGTQPWWPWAIGAGSALILAFGVWLWRKTRKRPRAAYAAAPGVPWRTRLMGTPAQRALARLEELEASGRLASEQRAAYAELGEIARELIAAMTDIATLELTTAELLRAVSGHPATAGGAAALESWIGRVDKVKYAGHEAGAAAIRADLEDARALVAVLTSGAPSRAAAPVAAAPAPRQAARVISGSESEPEPEPEPGLGSGSEPGSEPEPGSGSGSEPESGSAPEDDHARYRRPVAAKRAAVLVDDDAPEEPAR